MKRTLKIEVDCGETTCASQPGGKFCEFVESIQRDKWPKIPKGIKCGIFDTPLDDKDGRLQRCPACKNAEAKDAE